MKIKKLSFKKFKSSFLLVLVAALTLEITTLVQYYYSSKGLRDESSLRAQGQLDATTNKILYIVNSVETAVRNTEWIAQWALEVPDSLASVSGRLVRDNPIIIGSTLAILPGYYKDRLLYSPYYFQDTTNKLIYKSLATEAYDYPNKDWFKKPMELQRDYWSEPYIDEGGGEILMTTYSYPIKDKSGNYVAILTADISLDWLTEIIEGVQVYPNSFGMLISREGQFMAAPIETLIMKQNIYDYARQRKDSANFFNLNKALLSGSNGVMTVLDNGVKNDVYFTPIEKTGWSLSVVIPEKEIYSKLRKVKRIVNILQLLGLAIIIWIIRMASKNYRNIQLLNQKKERMENELHIGREIQMSMIPKTFPPFPDRKELDLFANIVPAKEVSGDMYDFFVEDEKLYFCIGDVSGKGVPASLVMAVARSLFRSVSKHEHSPKKIVEQMNESLFDMNETCMFVTFFCGILDLHSGVLKYCNAGHNAPLILNGDMKFLPIEPNLPLGIDGSYNYIQQEILLTYDNAMFIYTDGLTEAENIHHEMFGEERMKESLHRRVSAKEHLENMQKSVAQFVGDAPQSDDLTMLFIRYLNIKPEEENWKLLLHNDIKEISLLKDFIETIAEEKKIDESVASGINLAVEEAVANVMNYAYPQGTVGRINIEVLKHPDSLECIITDSGKPFDPTALKDVDTTLSAQEREIGGLGIHLYKNIMDKVDYERKDGKNILTLIKKL